jgi:integrase/recombinase XerD
MNIIFCGGNRMIKDIDKLFQEFIFECEFSQKLRPETLRGYKETYKTFKKLVPTITLESLNSYLLTQFFRLLNERKRIVGRGTIKTGVRKSTIATYRNKLNGFFTWLENKNLITENPFKHMAYPTHTYEDRKFLKKSDIEKIFTAINLSQTKNLLILKRNVLLFYVLLFCGLRREELNLLQIRDIDFERKILTVRAENSKSQMTRKLPLHTEVLLRLKDYLAERRKYTTQYLFVSNNHDEKLSYAGLKHLVARLNVLSGIKFHLHQFRHTFAINFLKQSNNLFKLKELLGHKDIRMTQVYLRCMPTDEMRGDVESMSIDKLI